MLLGGGEVGQMWPYCGGAAYLDPVCGSVPSPAHPPLFFWVNNLLGDYLRTGSLSETLRTTTTHTRTITHPPTPLSYCIALTRGSHPIRIHLPWCGG